MVSMRPGAPPCLRPASHLCVDEPCASWIIDSRRAGGRQQFRARLGAKSQLLAPIVVCLSHAGIAVGSTQRVLGAAGAEGLYSPTVWGTSGHDWRWPESREGRQENAGGQEAASKLGE